MRDWEYGVSVVDLLMGNIPENLEFKLSEIITLIKNEGGFGEDIYEDVDTRAIDITELYFMFKEDYEQFNSYLNENGITGIKKITADNSSLEFLLDYLIYIKDESVPGEEIDDEEIKEEIRASESYKHLCELIEKIKKEIT
jgi:hypothetical protein